MKPILDLLAFRSALIHTCTYVRRTLPDTGSARECRGLLWCGEVAKLIHQAEPIQVVPLFYNPAV